MFTTLANACTVGFCMVLFGHADWSKPHTASFFHLADQAVIINVDMDLRETDDPYWIAGRKELKKIIGKKVVFCIGDPDGHFNFIARCYLYDTIGSLIDIAEEMHKRGFPGHDPGTTGNDKSVKAAPDTANAPPKP